MSGVVSGLTPAVSCGCVQMRRRGENKKPRFSLRKLGLSVLNLVAGLGFEPKTFGLCLLLQLSLLRHKYWRICSLDYTFTLLILKGTCHLVSTPSLSAI